ncbi:hypothetical protein SNQ23_004357 [Cronobacter dublinensis]|nr:hypothetical protein [Cronobacter dublinensis]EMD9246118.1 hypothetical protein [Cronobacter dublinensis]
MSDRAYQTGTRLAISASVRCIGFLRWRVVCGYGGRFGVRGQAVTAITLRLYALVYFLKVIYAEVARHFNGIGVRPDAVSRDDNCDEFTSAQNLNYTHRRAELAVQ